MSEQASEERPFARIQQTCGDVDAAFTAAPLIVEGTYRTGHQEHIYIECQGMVSWVDPDGTLVVEGSMQCPYYVHNALVHAFGLPPGRVRVRAATVGGGFGGKEDYPSLIALHAALLARASGRRVKLVYDRHEDIVGTTKRHPSVVTHRTAVDADGRLIAAAIDILLDGGAYRTLSPVVLSRAVLHALGPYRCPHVRIEGRVVPTNTATNGAFRGFGVPQVAFAAERHMDAIARRVGLDPYEIRHRNALRTGDTLPSGQRLDRDVHVVECLERADRLTGFRRRWRELEAGRAAEASAPARRGVGLSLYFHGSGFTGNGERRMQSPVTAQIAPDGRIHVLTAMTDMGQGCAVVFPQIAADAAGVTLDDVSFAPPDTAEVPDSGPTVASRTTMVVGGTIARAVEELRDRVLAWCAADREDPSVRVERGTVTGAAGPIASFRDVARRAVEVCGPLEVTRRYEPPPWQTFDDETYRGAAYPAYAWGADVVEVTTDADLLETHVERATVVCDVGRVVHPTLCAGQVEGGTLQSIGYGLMEDMALDEGRYVHDRLATYLIPTIKDSPVISVELFEGASSDRADGPKGVGELPMDGAAPALAQAIENATGIQPTAIPVTPERLLSWLRADQVVRSATGEEPGR